MITKKDWDMIARCVANHPAGIKGDDATDLLKKLSVLAAGKISENTCVNSYGKVTKKVVIEYEEDI